MDAPPLFSVYADYITSRRKINTEFSKAAAISVII